MQDVLFSSAFDIPLKKFFVGRDQELQQLYELTRCDEPIMLRGAVGIGKTTFLRMFMQKYSDHFPGGVFYFSSDKLRSPEDINERIKDRGKSSLKKLVIFDEVDGIQRKQLASYQKVFLDLSFNKDISLVVSGRYLSPDFIVSASQIELEKLSVSEIIEMRMRYFKDSVSQTRFKNILSDDKLNRIAKVLDGNPMLFNILMRAPKDVLENIQSSLEAKEEIRELSREVRSEKEVYEDTIDSKGFSVDAINIILAFVFFLITYFSSQKSIVDPENWTRC